MTYKRHCLLCSIVVLDSQGQISLHMSWGVPGTSVSFTNKTDRHTITEILPKVALSTINQTKPMPWRE